MSQDGKNDMTRPDTRANRGRHDANNSFAVILRKRSRLPWYYRNTYGLYRERTFGAGQGVGHAGVDRSRDIERACKGFKNSLGDVMRLFTIL